MNELIENIKNIMMNVATGKARIQNANDEYKRIFQELDELFVINNMKNPNDFSDLWEFRNYWKNEQGMQTYDDRRSYIIALYKNIKFKNTIVKSGAYSFVHLEMIENLKTLKNADFDISKLVRFCEELNTVFSCKCYLSTAILIRAIADHIPPIFEKNTFTEVANNYGTKSFKNSMKNLDNSLRNIADSYLHTQIRKKEVLPNSNQVDFSNDLDVLLTEIYRFLK